MLIAVASKDGRDINQHFGHAERFLIYEVEGSEAKLVDEKKVERYCSYDQDHPLRAHLLKSHRRCPCRVPCRGVRPDRPGPPDGDGAVRGSTLSWRKGQSGRLWWNFLKCCELNAEGR